MAIATIKENIIGVIMVAAHPFLFFLKSIVWHLPNTNSNWSTCFHCLVPVLLLVTFQRVFNCVSFVIVLMFWMGDCVLQAQGDPIPFFERSNQCGRGSIWIRGNKPVVKTILAKDSSKLLLKNNLKVNRKRFNFWTKCRTSFYLIGTFACRVSARRPAYYGGSNRPSTDAQWWWQSDLSPIFGSNFHTFALWLCEYDNLNLHTDRQTDIDIYMYINVSISQKPSQWFAQQIFSTGLL